MDIAAEEGWLSVCYGVQTLQGNKLHYSDVLMASVLFSKKKVKHPFKFKYYIS